MKARKIVQITATARPNHDGDHTLYALCDDGTLWVSWYPLGDPAEWHPIANVPLSSHLSSSPTEPAQTP